MAVKSVANAKGWRFPERTTTGGTQNYLMKTEIGKRQELVQGNRKRGEVKSSEEIGFLAFVVAQIRVAHLGRTTSTAIIGV
jgi:hypothetical protein